MEREMEKVNILTKRGATRHCCYGLCKSDSRYYDRDYMMGVFWIPFPKSHKDLEKCKRWVRACGRENFTTDRVNKWTYICSKHFVGEHGPTDENPDPIPANCTPQQVQKLSKKRKPPTPRTNGVSKRLRLTGSDSESPACHLDNQLDGVGHLHVPGSVADGKMAATVSNPFSLPSGQIGSDQQMTMCSILQEAVLSLCQANYPETTQLEVDAIICISVLNSAEQHVVKIHEKLNDNFESMYIAQNQNSSNSILGKQAVSGVVDHPEVVKVRSVASPHVDQQAFGQSLTRHNRRISGRTRMANIQKRLSDGVDSFSKRSKIDSPSNQICDIEPVKIKVEPHDDEDNSKASFGLVDDSSGEVSHLEPHPTALYRSDIPVEPPDKNARLPQSSVLLHPSRQTMSGQYPVPGPQSNQFSVGNRNVSSTVTHESELQTLTSAPDATTSHSITDVHMPIIPLDSKAEVQQVASHLDPDISADGSEQNLSQLEMVQGMEEQYLQSLPSNGEDDTEDFEDGQDMKYGEQAEASEVRFHPSFYFQMSKVPGISDQVTESSGYQASLSAEKNYFHCCFCGARFTTLKARNRHETHVCTKCSYACEICGKMFSRMDNMKRHLWKIHENRNY